ncbi:xyloglucan endotransglucosylase protein 7-like isoform X2 [Andrographis paniculata]|uniref:xyloglucan endotransglucosylase protein 7-like isoform X2 n=1 Tax=Andrographis paniculata TaxID=175694 RepID=UPI0021E785DC|nr:xyloglucan endotransglucosylase protein 7-like isoform X2 [Andrographis paniculata]
MPPAARATHSHPHPPPPRSSNKLIPYLAFVIFSAIFVFKVDILISQTISSARRNQVEAMMRRGSEKVVVRNGTFHQHFIHSWGEDRAHILEDGELLELSLDKLSGAGFESRRTFLFAKIDMQIKLIPGNSAGTVTTYYLSSEGNRHDEIDFEFLGNSTGNPYTLHTNVFCQGKGEREQQFFLWFDPTQDFHTYTILWNPKTILFLVDEIPIRQFRNMERYHVPFPKAQPMRLYSSLWNADDWATQGGRVKTDWSAAPFVAAYRNFSVDGCVWSYRTKSSACTAEELQSRPAMTAELDRRSRLRMRKVQRDHMVYDYCRDRWRFPRGPARECRYN